MSNKIKLERYFYPVGQGLCCREQFILEDGRKFNLVYDCGGSSYTSGRCFELKKSNYGKKSERYPYPCVREFIKKELNGVIINALYISHLHDDHINILPFLESVCKVDNIILPYFSPKDIVYNLLDPKIENNEITMSLLGNAGNFKVPIVASRFINDSERSFEIFKNSKIYLILPEEHGHTTDFNTRGDNNFISSGTDLLSRIGFPEISNIWQYLPYNYNKPQDATDAFINETLKDFEQVFTDLSAFIEYRETIKHKYGQIISSKGGMRRSSVNYRGRYFNEQSTVLFSLPKDDILNSASFYDIICQRTHYLGYCSECKICITDKVRQKRKGDCKPGCVYLGDYLSKPQYLYDNLKPKLVTHKSKIHTLQVAHHGSQNGVLVDDFYNENICVISYGETNSYGHPHKKLEKAINNAERVDVTESKEYIQRYDL